MKIIELRASNFARLQAVEIRPDGALVPISGKNSQGKTSILKAIWTAFVGRSAAPPRVIRDGAEEARLQVAIGSDKVEIVITRTIKRGKHDDELWDLKVTQADGGRVTRKPQELIDSCLDALAFDPLAFAREKPKEQLAQLKALVPGVDFAALASKRLELFEQRTDANRRHKAERAVADGVVLPPGAEPAAVDSDALIEQLRQAHEHNNKVAGLEHRARSLRVDAEDKHARAKQLRVQADALEEAASLQFDEADRAELTAQPAIDVAPLTAELSSAQRTAHIRGLFKERANAEAKASAAQRESDGLSEAINALDADVRAAVEAAKLPAGLSLTEEGVLLNGRPFELAGTAEKIMASAEVRMALAPELRVMLLDEGSELDSGMLASLQALAEKRSYQVWVARVAEGDAPGFIIEDGRVAAHRKEAAE